MISIPAITADQMREVDRLMVEVYHIQLIQMMERAGWYLAELARTLLDGDVAGKRVAVAAGRGNNGGGGLVAAGHLSNWGAEVTVLVEAETLTGVRQEQWKILAHLPVTRRIGTQALQAVLETPWVLIIDALIGYGLRGSPQGWAAECIRQISASSAPVLALDVPSGLDATTGAAQDPCISAETTMTLALPKTGLLVQGAALYVGDLVLADIGVPRSLYERLGIRVGSIFAQRSLLKLR